MSQNNLQATENFTREAFWLKTGESSLFTWLYLPTKKSDVDIGFVLCPPLGHEYVHTYRTYRKLAESLASVGVPVIRFDLHGMGNSGGDALDPNQFEIWQLNIAAQIDFLKEKTSVKKIGLFGVRMGASLALQACLSQDITQLIVWRPILKGKQYARELTALSKFSSSTHQDEDQFIESGGFVIAQPTLAALESLDLNQESSLKVNRLLEINDGTLATDKLKKILLNPESYEKFNTLSYEAMMAEPQVAKTPDDVIEKISAWVFLSDQENKTLAKSKKTKKNANHFDVEKTHSFPQSSISEEALFINQKLFSILSQPTNADQDKKTFIVLCNSGAVHTVGPNRLYVELSRNLVEQGYSTLRLDLHNIGDSVVEQVDNDGFPYPQESKAVADIVDVAHYLRSRFPSHQIIVGGVCSGAYWAYRAATQVQPGLFNEIYIINPLTFDWTDASVLEDPQDQGAVRDKIYYLHSAKSKDKWIKLLKGQVDFKKLFLTAIKIFIVKIKSIALGFFELLHLLPEKKLVTDLMQIRAKRIGIHFIFSKLDPGYDLLVASGGVQVKRMMQKGKFSTDFIQDADHTFSKSIHRRELLDKLLARLPKN